MQYFPTRFGKFHSITERNLWDSIQQFHSNLSSRGDCSILIIPKGIKEAIDLFMEANIMVCAEKKYYLLAKPFAEEMVGDQTYSFRRILQKLGTRSKINLSQVARKVESWRSWIRRSHCVFGRKLRTMIFWPLGLVCGKLFLKSPNFSIVDDVRTSVFKTRQTFRKHWRRAVLLQRDFIKN